MTDHPCSDEPGPEDTAEAAEAAALQAESRAAAARARALELRRLAESGTMTEPEPDTAATPLAQLPNRGRRRLGAAALAVTTVAICALAGLSGAMLWQRHNDDRQQRRVAEISAVAKQSAINLMSLDYNDAEGSIQRVLDGATGGFKDNFSTQSDILIKGMKEAKVVTTVTVQSVAVQQYSDDSAVVLVAAQSQATNVEDTRKNPQKFRVLVTLTEDSGQLKTSQVEFV